MDKSIEYIEMCEKAKDYLKKDYFVDTITTGYEYRGSDVFYHEKTNGLGSVGCHKMIWLPRQDQLQEMLQNDKWYHNLDGDGLIQYWEKLTEEQIGSLNSMEQLWLAFVMKEKYNKKWTGEKWKRSLQEKIFVGIR